MNSLKDIREAFVRILGEPPEQREEALAALPADVRAQVESLLGAHASSGDFLCSVDRADPKPGVRIGPYSLIEEIGRGGMGVVFRARRADGEFPRDAAIKFAGGRLYPPEAERRFIAEGRILALIDHPNVVRVLDAGVWQGRRYLVMEFVDGTPLTEHCRQNALPLAARLKLFQKLCESIQCAHQHLVIHRDLKPGNILVSADGALKVLDFGIARLLEADWEQDDATRTALNPLSLSCASPEQVRHERLATTTDIYSLGLLLYELLTGHSPQSDGTPAEIAARIVSEDPAPPSRLADDISPDLDAIVAKALAKEPAIRYQSAAELAAEVERFLEGRPVIARPPSRWYLLSRFCSRNKLATGLAAALVLAVFIGLGGSIWFAQRLGQQKQLAERRFDQARRLILIIIHDIQPKLGSINGTIAIRKELIEKSVAYLDAVAKDASGSPPLMRDLVGAYMELASVSASPNGSNVGDIKTAAAMLKSAEAIVNRLVAEQPQDVETLVTAVECYQKGAYLSIVPALAENGAKLAQKAVELSERLAVVSPGDRANDEIARSKTALGDMLSSETTKRIALYEEARWLWEDRLRRGGGSAAELRSKLTVLNRNLADAFGNAGNFRKSLEHASAAHELDKLRYAANPQSPRALMAFSFDLGLMARAYSGLGERVLARDLLLQSVALREANLAANPTDRRAVERLAFAVHELAEMDQALQDPISARKGFLRASELYSGLNATTPLIDQASYRLMSSYWHLGKLDLQAGKRETGCRWLSKAVAQMGAYQKQDHPTADDVSVLPEIRKDFSSCGAPNGSR